jgi:cytosine/uracil/thiamine/allantoin permease
MGGMKFHLKGLVGFFIFLAVSAALIALYSRRLDNVLAIVWLSIVLAGSAFLIYERSTGERNDPLTRARPTLPGSGWSGVLPPRVMRWMLGESDPDESGDRKHRQ